VPNSIIAFCCFCFSVLIGSASAQTASEFVVNAFKGFDQDYREKWGFDELREDGERTWFGRFSPESGGLWTLLTVDGQDPTEEETAEYVEEKKAQRERETSDDEQGGPPRSPIDSIDLTTLVLEQNTSESLVYSFLPVGRGDQAKMMKKMRGELSVRKSDSCIEYLEITNPKPFRPQITVKLNRFFSRFDFGSPTGENIGVGGACKNIVPLGTQFEMDMKALGLMNIDVSVRATYSNFVLFSAPKS
jgi:hypothetical protein